MKSKVENGEVIEAFRKQKHWGALMYEVDISIVQDIMKREEAFITNALNQQREQIVGEIEKYLQLDWKPTEGYGSEEEKGFQKGIIAEQGQVKRKLKEFLTKLEK